MASVLLNKCLHAITQPNTPHTNFAVVNIIITRYTSIRTSSHECASSFPFSITRFVNDAPPSLEPLNCYRRQSHSASKSIVCLRRDVWTRMHEFAHTPTWKCLNCLSCCSTETPKLTWRAAAVSLDVVYAVQLNFYFAPRMATRGLCRHWRLCVCAKTLICSTRVSGTVSAKHWASEGAIASYNVCACACSVRTQLWHKVCTHQRISEAMMVPNWWCTDKFMHYNNKRQTPQAYSV